MHSGTSVYASNTPPDGLRNMPRIFSRILDGEEVQLSKWALQRTDIAESFALDHFQSMFFQLSLAQCFGTGFLTDWPVHIKFLKQLSFNLPRAERDHAIENQLTCLVPYAAELQPKEILKLRKAEEEAFVGFRAALAKAVDEYRNNYGSFTKADAKALFADVIKPKLSKLEVRINKARRSLIKGTVRKTLAYTAAISAGLYLGFLPQELVGLASALGLTKILADLTEDAMNRSDIEETVRDHDMYFLWRLQKLAKSK